MNYSNLCLGCMQQKPNNKACPNCGYINGSEKGEHYYLPEGTKLNDRYIVGHVLGHGGFGVTYIGFDTKLDVPVAVKEYLPSDISTRALGETTVTTFSGDKYDSYVYGLGRFIDEAKVLAKYNSHQCIVSINDYFTENNTAYIVMEYLDGISLSEYLKRRDGKISLDETLEIMRPVMDALREVHASGMIHRDVSPDNIFITKNRQIKLLDFGAARHAMGEKSKSLSVVLKPGYAPPEQYYTRGKQGPWTDVYATAATMYKMLTGEAPPEAMERMINHDLGNIELVDKTIKKALSKALNVDTDLRYKTIEEFYNELYCDELNININPNYENIRQNINDTFQNDNDVKKAMAKMQPEKAQKNSSKTDIEVDRDNLLEVEVPKSNIHSDKGKLTRICGRTLGNVNNRHTINYIFIYSFILLFLFILIMYIIFYK